MYISSQSNHEILSAVTTLVGSHREITAKLVVYLGEIEERRLHLEAGYPSMFEFCLKELRLSEGEAFRRLLAARLGRRFPIVHSLLASGAVHLSALELLRERFTEENHFELLEAVSGMSKREVEAWLTAHFPKPDLPSRITRTRVEPLSETRFKVEFTASAELRDKLELCRDLMSHTNPTRDLGVVIERAVDLLLGDLQRKRLARTKRRGRESSNSSAKPGRIKSAVRRKVYERDGLRCTYISPNGRRCDARAFLELDHVEPRAIGGGDHPENLRVRCRAHNQLAAEQVFGRVHIERARHLRQQKWECKQGEGARGPKPADEARTETWTKVLVALKGLGFRDSQARRAIAKAANLHGNAPTVELALRAAILAATADAA
jgi:hypothetical protein